jgi:hypothetical protein
MSNMPTSHRVTTDQTASDRLLSFDEQPVGNAPMRVRCSAGAVVGDQVWKRLQWIGKWSYARLLLDVPLKTYVKHRAEIVEISVQCLHLVAMKVSGLQRCLKRSKSGGSVV